MQTEAIPVKPSGQDIVRYSVTSLVFFAAVFVCGLIGKGPLAGHGEISLRPELGLASLLLILCGWNYLPIVVIGLAAISLRTPVVGSQIGYVLIDSVVTTLIAVTTAYFVRQSWKRYNWGTPRDFVVLGACAVFLPMVLASCQVAFVQNGTGATPFMLAWLGAVVPMCAMIPAGMKVVDWYFSEPREPISEYFGRGVTPGVQAIQYGVLVLTAGFIWLERLSGSNGRVFPMFIAMFWLALTSGLSAAAAGFLLGEGLLVAVNWFTKTNMPLFDLELASLVMGCAAVVAGGLVTARRFAEDQQRMQAEALRRQLAEMQVIRRLADSIIALQDEHALYQLGAEAIGEQLESDQVWLLWIPGDRAPAEERGYWAVPSMGRDRYSPDLSSTALLPLWTELARSQSQLLSRANAPNSKLVDDRLDVPLHQACGIKSLIFHPFSFDLNGGFYVVAILSYGRLRHWTGDELRFVAAISDQITIALQKTRLLGERDEKSRAFARMSQALVAETGDAFFKNLVLRLSEAAGSRGAYASKALDRKDEGVMLAFVDAGKVKKEFRFKVDGTPVEGTLEEGSLAIRDEVSKLFPRFVELIGTEARGFASARLNDSRGEPIGTLAIYDEKPLEDPEHVASVLRLFAARASAEIERSDRERLLRESEASYRMLLETAHEGIWILDAEGKTSYVNLGMASMLGFAPEDMIGKQIQDYVDEADRSKVILNLQGHLAGSAAQQDLRFKRHDGSSVWTMLSMSPILREDGAFGGALAMATDISERKQTEQELDRLVHERTAELVASNRELEAFCYSISHDLRQPLRAIDGFSRAVVEDLGDDIPDEVRDHLQRVRRAANRMSELIDALLTLSRLNRVEMTREKVNLSRMAEEILGEMAKTDAGRAETFSVRKDLAGVGDARLLHIALENLLSNAWKFSSRTEQPFIEVGSKKIEGKTCFFVRDNGIGFDMAYSSKLFKPFERLHSESDFYGTGIGLATVARIIARHGGTIWAEGVVGKGATFYFTLN